ncbi:hypothetical protein [Rhizobium terrae]|uniref:hypothetical protein n=1 Tax=Rhizobium terrae TaxID=2171756 RepID=UPI000E3B66FD|nr:hypothetical protein [Rhizobium terrae]
MSQFSKINPVLLIGFLASFTSAYGESPIKKDALALKAVEFQDWVDGHAIGKHGNREQMAVEFRRHGFDCTDSDSPQFRCVRFSCSNQGLMPLLGGSLLQWSIDDFQGKLYAGAIDYSFLKACYQEDQIRAAQKEFLAR